MKQLDNSTKLPSSNILAFFHECPAQVTRLTFQTSQAIKTCKDKFMNSTRYITERLQIVMQSVWNESLKRFHIAIEFISKPHSNGRNNNGNKAFL